MGPINALTSNMDTEVPRARDRLEKMMLLLDEYLRGEASPGQ